MAKFFGGPCDGWDKDLTDESIVVYFDKSNPTKFAQYDRQPDGNYKFVMIYDENDFQKVAG